MIKFKVKMIKVLPMSDRSDRRKTASRVFITEDDNPNDKPIVEIFSGYRYNKPHLLWKRQVIPTVLESLKLPDDTKVQWSQYAGCSCPCSPGFIIKSRGIPKNVFVNVESYEEQPELIGV